MKTHQVLSHDLFCKDFTRSRHNNCSGTERHDPQNWTSSDKQVHMVSVWSHTLPLCPPLQWWTSGYQGDFHGDLAGTGQGCGDQS
uniref:Uncharacterized protein n=1 Tax=Knipowitschia caucasica TaxID=637954 RepID=A0AAV2JLC0_KNICA